MRAICTKGGIIMLKGLVVTVILVLLVIIFITAKIMVKKRIWLARRCIIGKDSPEKLEELKNLAKSMFTNGTFSMPADFNDAETYEFSIELTKRKHEITMVKIKTEKSIVTCSSENPEPFVFYNGLSERGATIFVFVGLLSILTFIAILLFLPTLLISL